MAKKTSKKPLKKKKKAQKKFTKTQKKKAKRNRDPLASLKKKYHNLNVHEYVDYDYLKSLSEKELLWLNKFTEEEYRAYFNKDKKRHINKKANRKAIYNANNSRNRCIYSRAKGKKQLDFGDMDIIYNAMERENNLTNPEDAIIDMIDKARAGETEES